MAGPAPKPAGQRRRRNVPERGEWVDLEPLAAPVLPRLPEVEDWEWRPATFRAWEAWRADPVTAQWSPSDIDYAFDTIVLHNEFSAKTAGEIRLRMDSLGLTPKGKRDLRWRISEKPAEAERPMAQVRKLRAV